jgi:hypothetical protein
MIWGVGASCHIYVIFTKCVLGVCFVYMLLQSFNPVLLMSWLNLNFIEIRSIQGALLEQAWALIKPWVWLATSSHVSKSHVCKFIWVSLFLVTATYSHSIVGISCAVNIVGDWPMPFAKEITTSFILRLEFQSGRTRSWAVIFNQRGMHLLFALLTCLRECFVHRWISSLLWNNIVMMRELNGPLPPIFGCTYHRRLKLLLLAIGLVLDGLSKA